jgi:hypothetical protein
MSDHVHTCAICGAARYGGHRNGAEPVKHGVCCDACYAEHVIPARLEEIRAAERERDAGEYLARGWFVGPGRHFPGRRSG